jgi:opacity protein-like surface antigen
MRSSVNQGPLQGDALSALRGRAVGACVALLAAPAAAAAQGPYVEFSTGVTAAGRYESVPAGAFDMEPGFQVNFALGRELGHFRIEAEALYLGSEIDTPGAGAMQTEAYGALANVFYAPLDVRGLRIRPFLGAGVGVMYGERDVRNAAPLPNSEDNAWVWQLKAGGEYDVGPNVAVAGSYRYLKMNFDKDGAETAADSHAATLGVRFKSSR